MPQADPHARISHLTAHIRQMHRLGRSERTIECRVDVLSKLADWLEHDPATATQDDLERWQDTLLTTSDSWCRWCTHVIRPYYRFIHARGLRTDDPTALLVMPPERRAIPRPMSETDVMRMLREAPDWLRPYLLLAGWCGLRAVEIARLRGEHVTVLDGRAWILVHGKGNRHRTVPVPMWMWPLLAPHIPPLGPCWQRRRGNGPVTAKQVSDNCNHFLRSIGIADSLHSLRHRVATITLRQTGSLRTVQELLGHANLTHLQVYTRVEPQHVADAVDGLPQPRQEYGEVHPLPRRRTDSG